MSGPPKVPRTPYPYRGPCRYRCRRIFRVRVPRFPAPYPVHAESTDLISTTGPRTPKQKAKRGRRTSCRRYYPREIDQMPEDTFALITLDVKALQGSHLKQEAYTPRQPTRRDKLDQKTKRNRGTSLLPLLPGADRSGTRRHPRTRTRRRQNPAGSQRKQEAKATAINQEPAKDQWCSPSPLSRPIMNEGQVAARRQRDGRSRIPLLCPRRAMWRN